MHRSYCSSGKIENITYYVNSTRQRSSQYKVRRVLGLWWLIHLGDFFQKKCFVFSKNTRHVEFVIVCEGNQWDIRVNRGMIIVIDNNNTYYLHTYIHTHIWSLDTLIFSRSRQRSYRLTAHIDNMLPFYVVSAVRFKLNHVPCKHWQHNICHTQHSFPFVY